MNEKEGDMKQSLVYSIFLGVLLLPLNVMADGIAMKAEIDYGDAPITVTITMSTDEWRDVSCALRNYDSFRMVRSETLAEKLPSEQLRILIERALKRIKKDTTFEKTIGGKEK